MDLWKRRRIKIVLTALVGFICLSIAAVLFTIGGIFYTVEKSKILNYVGTTCIITSVSTKTLTCIIYMFHGECHVASWRVDRQNTTERVVTLEGTTHTSQTLLGRSARSEYVSSKQQFEVKLILEEYYLSINDLSYRNKKISYRINHD